MKANLKKILGLTALCLGLFTNAIPTWAGEVSAPEVYVGNRNGIPYATGSMVGARYSTDSLQFIGCEIDFRGPVVPVPYVYCTAVDSTDKYLQCGSNDPKDIETVQAMTDSSYIYFELADRSLGKCGNLTIYNSSGHLK